MKTHLCKCHSSLESDWGLSGPVQINRMRVWLFRKTHLFSLAPVTLGHLLELQEGATEGKLNWKNQPPPPWMGRIAPFMGLPWEARGSRPESEEVNQPFPVFSHPAGSTPFGAVAFGHVLSKTNEHLTWVLETNTGLGQFLHLLRMNTSLWLSSQQGPTSELRG